MLLLEALAVIGGSLVLSGMTDQPAMGFAVWVLWLIWRALATRDELPVLAVVMTYHWAQMVCGNFYIWFTERHIAGGRVDYEYLYVMLSLGCVVATVIGMAAGRKSIDHYVHQQANREIALSWQSLLAIYVLMFLSRTGLDELAGSAPLMRQGIVMLNSARVAVFYLIMRRFVRTENYAGAAAFLLAEVAVGMSGYFSGFKEPLLITIVVTVEVFDRRNAMHWLTLTAVMVSAVTLGAMWIGIRGTIRAQIEKGRTTTTSERVSSFMQSGRMWLGGEDYEKWAAFDGMIMRMWDVTYPAMALQRVPSALPHTNGEFIKEAMVHAVTPRFLFPDKAIIGNESLRTSKYAGIHLAGAEQNTSIAFGYAIESYIDFGLPWMWLPSLIFGFVLGVGYSFLLRTLQHRELAVATATLVYWVTLNLANMSWAKRLGAFTSAFLYIVPLCFLLDRWLLMKLPDAPSTEAPAVPTFSQTVRRA